MAIKRTSYEDASYTEAEYREPMQPEKESILGMLTVRIVTTREQAIFANGEISIGQFIDKYLADSAKDDEEVQSITLNLGEPK